MADQADPRCALCPQLSCSPGEVYIWVSLLRLFWSILRLSWSILSRISRISEIQSLRFAHIVVVSCGLIWRTLLGLFWCMLLGLIETTAKTFETTETVRPTNNYKKNCFIFLRVLTHLTVPHPLVVVSVWSHLMQASRSLLTNVFRSQKENENEKEIERRTQTHTHTHTHTHTPVLKRTPRSWNSRRQSSKTY